MNVVGAELNGVASSLVRRERLARGLTQEALADLCGLDRTYISAIERRERNISLNTLGRILEALDLGSSSYAQAVLS